MTTELQPIIKRRGLLNNDLFGLIAIHNEGKASYSLGDITSYCKGKMSEYPSSLKNAVFTHLPDEIVIMENGKDITLIIQKTDVKIDKKDKNINKY